MTLGVEVGKAAAVAGGSARASRWADYLELTKPRITFMVLITTLIGFFMGTSGPTDLLRLVHTLLATALVAGGASAVNQYLERDLDGRMRRTANRPLPAGRLAPRSALLFGWGLAVAGVIYLGLATNPLAGAVAAATVISYAFVYTPLKRVTSLATIAGAVPGALPPVGGWAAATNHLSVEAWTLFAIVFLWQLPHFLAIGWIYREDYARAGYPLLPVVDEDGRATGRHMVLWSLALVPVSLVPTALGMTGPIYLGGALLLGLLYLAASASFALSVRDFLARRLFLVSVVYLPLLWALMVLDKTKL